MMQVGDVLGALIGWWGVLPEDGVMFQEAVFKSTTMRPTVLKHNCMLVTTQGTLTRFVEYACTPGTVLRTLDDLRTEGHLSAACATRIHDCVHQRLDPSGQWRKR
jgi:hypothetical protein